MRTCEAFTPTTLCQKPESPLPFQCDDGSIWHLCSEHAVKWEAARTAWAATRAKALKAVKPTLISKALDAMRKHHEPAV